MKRLSYLVTCLILLVAASAAAQVPLPRASPESVGLSSRRLQKIARTLRNDIDNGRIPGAVVAIARRGRLAYFEAFGYRDKAANLPMTTDTIFDLASMTKPLASVGALMLYEEGRLFLSDPVSKYFPAMGKMSVAVLHTDPETGHIEAVIRTDSAAGKPIIETVPAVRPMTSHDLMCHTSGLTYGFMGDTVVHKMYPQLESIAAGTMTGSEFVDKLSTLPLVHQPGTVWEYSLSTGVLGLVIESVTQQKLGEYLRERLFRPLGMTDTGFLVSADQAIRYAKPLPADPVTGKPQSILDLTKPLKFECAGGCAASTAADYLRFAQMLLNGGRLGGKRILGPKTVEYMTADHLAGGITSSIVQIGPEYEDYGFGLGVAVRRHTGVATSIGSAGDYNWPGAFGTLFWVDPKEKLVVVFMTAARGPTVSYYRQLMRPLVLQAIID